MHRLIRWGVEQKKMNEQMKLSIIIPAYNAEPYLSELIECLAKQMREGVEVIIVDDGSDEKVTGELKYLATWLRIYRQKNKGAGAARNTGINRARGEYISFIDADDLVSENYIDNILEKCKHVFDVCEMSWRSLNNQGVQFDYKLKSEADRLPNCSSCMRVFRREYIGDTRFTEIKDATEDEDFSRRVGYLNDGDFKREVITDYMYFYRTYVPNSQSKGFKEGKRKTKRIVYYFNKVTSDMRGLIDQIKKDDELNEVWLLTNHNELPELKRWCQIHTPMRMWAHYTKGEPYNNIELIPVPLKADIALYVHQIHIIGGIETFIYTFAKIMQKFFSILYVVDIAPPEHIRKMSEVVTVVTGNKKVECETLIMLRILDKLPNNIIYKKSIQMCHACKSSPSLHIPQQCDFIVNVSEASKKSFGEEAKESTVIHNLINPPTTEPLLLVSATRIPAPDKGDNEKRMIRLAEMLNEKNIPFLWLNFSDGQLKNPPKGFHNMGLDMNAAQYFRKADYIVLLSSTEAWSYTLLEALTQNKPVLTCPFDSTYEMGVKDGVNGYILPFDMRFDVNRLLNIPKFEYEYDNNKIIDQWKKLLKRKPKRASGIMVKVRVEQPYKDLLLNRCLTRGYETYMPSNRANELKAKRLVAIIGGEERIKKRMSF